MSVQFFGGCCFIIGLTSGIIIVKYFLKKEVVIR